MAPELIGQRRIAKAESVIERLLRTMYATFAIEQTAIPAGPVQGATGTSVSLVLASLFGSLAVADFLLAEIVLNIPVLLRFRLPRHFWFTVIYDLVICICGPVVWGFLLLEVGSACRYLLRKLQGNDRLLGYMTSFGILIFILGNCLQFLATFHPKTMHDVLHIF